MNKTDLNLIIENYLRNPFRSFGLSLLIAFRLAWGPMSS